MEADAVVANAETELGRVDILETFYVAGADVGEALDGLLDAAGNAFVEIGISARAVSVHSISITPIRGAAWPRREECLCRRCS